MDCVVAMLRCIVVGDREYNNTEVVDYAELQVPEPTKDRVVRISSSL